MRSCGVILLLERCYLVFFSVFGQGLNDAGRGLNIAVVNPSTKEVYRIGRFDTFEAGAVTSVFRL